MDRNTTRKRGIIERIGSALPESNILFLILIGIIMIASAFAQGNHPSAVPDSDDYTVRNVLSIEGMRWILYNIQNSFRSYPPLSVIVFGTLGFGFAEKSGLLGTFIKQIGYSTSEKLILPVIIFIGINSSIASDVGYIVLVPLAGALYAGLGRNPLSGIVAAFAAVSAGFGASLIPGTADGLVGAITESVYVNTFNKPFPLNIITMNYIFMFASTFFLTGFLVIVTHFFGNRVEAYKYTLPENSITIGALTDQEKRGLHSALIAFGITMVVLIVGYFIGILQPYVDTTGRAFNPMLDNLLIILIILFIFPSLAYGYTLGTIKNSKDYIDLSVQAMGNISYIIVFAVFAGNFLAIFNYSGLDKFVANYGALFLVQANIQNPVLLMGSFIIISAFINLFLGSASAKWAILAPIFVPMLMIASNNTIGPEVIQIAYRI
ncbi:MAG: AbgT family transporter, partial [Brevinema sp.]